MLLVIHNLPKNTRYTDVKTLIKDKCGLTEMIVDNLVVDGTSKKVTVGLADEGDAALMVRKINGLYVCNQQLYVEDVRQKKASEQPYQPNASSSQYNECTQPQFENEIHGQQGKLQFQPMSLMSPSSSAPNFGVPFYMTAQNQNVGNNSQLTVQYPKVQVPMGNKPYEGRDIGFKQQYDGRKGGRSKSPEPRSRWKHSPGRSWDERDRDRSSGRRGHDRPHRNERSERYDRPQRNERHDRPQHDERYDRPQRNERYDRPQHNEHHDADRSYKKSFEDSFQKRPNQDHERNKQSSIRFQKSSSGFDQNWEHEERSTFNESSNLSRFNDNRHHNRESEPQRFTEDHPQAHAFNSRSLLSTPESRPVDFAKKRPYEFPNINTFGSQSKKFRSNPQFISKIQQKPSDNPFPTNFQKKNNPYLNNSPVYPTAPQTNSHLQKKGQHIQSNKAQTLLKVDSKWKSNKPVLINKVPVEHRKQQNFIKDLPSKPEFTKPKFVPNHQMVAKNEAWRVQAAAVIATQILNNMGMVLNKRDPVLIKLKACVRARIDVITGDNVSFTLGKMLKQYRQKFHDDDAFYNAVLQKVEASEREDFEARKKVVTETEKEQSGIKPPVVKSGPILSQNPGDLNSQRLPRYPDGNKKVLSQMKQAQKDELIDDTLYNLDSDHERALEKELDKFDELIKEELEDLERATDKSLSKFMNDVVMPDLRKVLTLHVKKRLLDIRTNLSVRILCQYKPPKRELLEAFLKNYGVISLKPSIKNRNVLIVTCDNYVNYDALCNKGSTVIGNLKISFKPLHITGISVKGKMKKQVASQINISSHNIIEVDSNSDNDKNISDGNESQSDNMNSEENKKINSDREKIQNNNDNECEVIPSNQNENVNVTEDNILKSKDVIEIDNSDTVNNEVIVCDTSPTTSTSTEAVNNAGHKFVEQDGEKSAVTDSIDVTEQAVSEIIDNIADDDLEDF